MRRAGSIPVGPSEGERRRVTARFGYDVPDPLDTMEQFERWQHGDLRHFRRPDLLCERARLRFILTWEGDPPLWIGERLREVEEALRLAP